MYIDILQIRHSEALVYQQWIGARMPPKQTQIDALLKAKAYSGTVTDAAAKRMRKAISLLIQKSPRRKIFNPVSNTHHQFSIGFVTLTLVDQGKDSIKEVYKKCLAPFLKWLRYTGVTDYVWKAELQVRGTVHYHIAVNKFIHYQILRDKWNLYQKKAGYLDKYAKKHKHFRPNSTDVHAIGKVDKIEAYLCKYLMKGGSGAVNGKVWDCSRNLKDAKYFSTELTYQNVDKLRTYCRKEINGEYSTIFTLPQGKPNLVLDRLQMSEYRKHLLAI